MTMKKVNIFEAKARLSEFLDLVEGGERVLICRRNRPIAELRALPSPRAGQRPLGGSELSVPDTFFTPLPTDVEDSFYAVPLVSGRGASPAAERRTRLSRAGKSTRRLKR
jgi:antitoxin (DNA-binding transcriptional repressor) of toxin-antitoxin stability system